MPQDKPTVDELRALGAALPPSHRLQAAETADVLSALVAVVTHGREILEAAKEGSAGILDFLHGHISDNRPEGADEPQRGQVAQPVTPAAPAVAVGSQQIDYDQLAAAIVRAQNKHEESSTVTADTPTVQTAPVAPQAQSTVHEGAAATPDAPAGAVVTPVSDTHQDGEPVTSLPPSVEPVAPDSEGTGIL